MSAHLLLSLALSLPQASPESTAIEGGDLVLRNGLVWNGRDFEPRDLYVSNGVFTTDGSTEREVDLTGQWVLPPLSEAHTHRFSTSYDAASARDMFLRAGVLYAANLCSPRDARSRCGDLANGRTGIDTLFTHGGLTASGGHPIRLYEELHSAVYGRPAETFWDENADSTFYVVDDERDLEQKWPLLVATRPDLVKTLMSRSCEFEKRRDDPKYYGNKGLDPELMPSIVARAREEGLRVATHVDCAADFRSAVEAGVDILAHTPGYLARSPDEWERFALTVEDAERARERSVVHITTASVARGEVARDVVRHNLLLLKEAGVPIAIGSDQWEQGPKSERDMLVELDVFTPRELLRAWCEDSARALYPDRRLGRLEPGFEGNLIVLGGDPLDDLEHLDDVRLVVKRGVVLWERVGD